MVTFMRGFQAGTGFSSTHCASAAASSMKTPPATDGHKYDDVRCVVFGLGLGARRAHPPSGAATDEQRRPRPKTTQPFGRQSFLAQASLLAPHRPMKGMLVARASPAPKMPCRERHRIYAHQHCSHDCFFAAKGGFDLAFEDGERFLEVVAMRRRAAAGRDVHVDKAITTVRVVAGEQNGVGVPHDSEVGKALIFVRVRNREIALKIVRRDRRFGLGCDGVVVHGSKGRKMTRMARLRRNEDQSIKRMRNRPEKTKNGQNKL
jgi:hypothetical protein